MSEEGGTTREGSRQATTGKKKEKKNIKSMAAEPLELDDDRSRCAICLAVELDDPTALFGLAPTDGQPEAGSDGAAEAVDHAPRVDETDDTDREEQGTVTGAPTDLPSCPHRFCRGCIEGWAAYAHVCPTCKAPFERLGSLADPGDVDGSLPTAPITAAPAVTHHPGHGHQRGGEGSCLRARNI